MADQKIKIHWTMSAAGDNLRGARARKEVSGIADIPKHLEFCAHSETCEIDSLLTAFGFHRADPITLATALGSKTDKIKFLIACRSGITSPTYFVQQINSLSNIIGNRIYINMVAGHSPKEFKYYGDILAPELRYDRTDEFLSICRAFWDARGPVNFSGDYYQITNGQINTPFNFGNGDRPMIYLGGNSARAYELAAKHADCLLTIPTTPDKMKSRILPLLATGTQVGLLVSLITRETREEAIAEADLLIAPLDDRAQKVHLDFKQNSVSKVFNDTISNAHRGDQWQNSYLWQGAVPYLGAPAIAIVGSYHEVALAMMEYREIGITQFLLKGWPDLVEMSHFHKGVLPILRKLEKQYHSELNKKSTI